MQRAYGFNVGKGHPSSSVSHLPQLNLFVSWAMFTPRRRKKWGGDEFEDFQVLPGNKAQKKSLAGVTVLAAGEF